MIKLKFVQEHTELDPRLWDGTDLRPEVRLALLRIAQDFKEYVGNNNDSVEFDIVDVVITGSQAGYYYTQHSDLDLHLVVNYDVIECDRELEELFDTKRLLYKRDHHITIRGIPVEMYVEDLDEPARGPRYSIGLNQWITHPKKNQAQRIDHSEIAKMTEVWAMLIERSLEAKNPKIAKKTLELLRKYRQMGLKSTGEFGTANLVYKTLRNNKTLETLADFVDRAHDNSLSIPRINHEGCEAAKNGKTDFISN